METHEQAVKRGKKSRKSGNAFETRVRKDLEKRGWIVDKWSNNVSDYPDSNINLSPEKREDRKLIPAKHKFRGPGIPMMLTSGFPDFICFRTNKESIIQIDSDDSKQIREIKRKYNHYIKKCPDEPIICSQGIKIIPKFEMMAVECKINGILDKEEKEKCKWLLGNNIFSKILIASKHKIKNRIYIEYKEFGTKSGGKINERENI